MIRKQLIGISIAIILTVWSGVAQAITCEECRDIKKNRSFVESEIGHKEDALRQAYDKKRFQEVSDLRRQITDLKITLIDLQKKDVGCKDACRPDAMKEDECNLIRSEIVKLEGDSAAPIDKIDALYRNLASCNRELAKIKKQK